MGDIFTLMLIGTVISLIARIMHPQRYNLNIVATIFIGIIAVLLSQIGIPFGLYDKGSMLSFFLPIIFTSFFVFIYGQFKS